MSKMNINIDDKIAIILNILSKKQKKDFINESLYNFIQDENNLKKYFDKNNLQLIKQIIQLSIEKNNEDSDSIASENKEKKKFQISNKDEDSIKNMWG